MLPRLGWLEAHPEASTFCPQPASGENTLATAIPPVAGNPRYNHPLLAEIQRDRIEVVLVSPRNPLNIGAAARAMANFGFSHLTVVAPYEPHWREAKSAIGAVDILENAKSTERLSQALTNCTLVIGTATIGDRCPEQPVISLPDLPRRVERGVGPEGRAALVFGPEKRGLTRDDLALCHLLVEIPTHPGQPSMNLGQAVAVCLYELGARGVAPIRQGDVALPSGSEDPPASMRDLDLLAQVVADTMEASYYSPVAMRKANRHDLDLLLRRLSLTSADVRRVLGLFRRVLWRLQHPNG